MPEELKIHFDLHILTNINGDAIDEYGNTVGDTDRQHVPVVRRAISNAPVNPNMAYHSPEGWRTPVDIGGPLNLAAHELYPVPSPGGDWEHTFKNDILEDSTKQ